MGKRDAIAMFNGMGPMGPNGPDGPMGPNGFNPKNVTYAKLNDAGTYYWANPNINVLKSDWSLILHDKKRGKYRLFFIPAGSIGQGELHERDDRTSVFDLRIKPVSFEDMNSGYSFLRYYVATVRCPVDEDGDTERNLDEKRMTKHDAIGLFNQMGYGLKNAATTYAKLNGSGTFYWANPNTNVLKSDWALILNDDSNCRLHLFVIHAGSIGQGELHERNDRTSVFNLRIKPVSFEDINSGYSFLGYLAETIKYMDSDL